MMRSPKLETGNYEHKTEKTSRNLEIFQKIGHGDKWKNVN